MQKSTRRTSQPKKTSQKWGKILEMEATYEDKYQRMPRDLGQ